MAVNAKIVLNVTVRDRG